MDSTERDNTEPDRERDFSNGYLYLLDTYVNLYNITLRQINTMHTALSHIRMDVLTIANNTNNENNRYVFTSDQRHLLNFYISNYNDTRSEIVSSYNFIDNIRMGINNINNIILNIPMTNESNTQATQQNPRGRSSSQPAQQPYTLFPVPTPTISTNPIERSHRLTNNNSYWLYEGIYTVPVRNHEFIDVPIIPTPEQIGNATLDNSFNSIENPINTQCPISLEHFNPQQWVTQIIPCGHVFNYTQLRSWFRSSSRCPMCRYDIRDYQPLTRNTESVYINDASASAVDLSYNNINNNTSTRNSSRRISNRSRNAVNGINNEDGNNLSAITESLLRNFLNVDNVDSLFTNHIYSFDSSNNEYIFQNNMRNNNNSNNT